MLKFQLVTDGRESETVLIALSEIASVRQYEDRKAYGGYFSASEIVLKNGKSFRVYGHVESDVRNAFEVSEIGA